MQQEPNASSKFTSLVQSSDKDKDKDGSNIPEDINDDVKFTSGGNDKPSPNDGDDMDIDKEDKEDFVESIIGETTEGYKFDTFVEALQEIVIEDQFNQMQMAFMDKYIDEFDANKENKLIYTTIFNEYTAMTESYIEKNLIARVPQYKLDDFYKMLETRKEQIDDQILDTLLSFGDFQMFKEMMLDYKARKNNKQDLFAGISIEKANDNNQIKSFDNFDYLNEQFRKKHPGFNKKK